MTTRISSYSRIVVVCLVLAAFVGGMIVPSLAIAKMEREIEMEGDPTDGLDYSGGGSGGGGILDDGDEGFPSSGLVISKGDFYQEFAIGFLLVFSKWENGQLTYFIFLRQPIDYPSGGKYR